MFSIKMSENDLKQISELTHKIIEAKIKFKQDILEYLNIENSDEIDIYEILKSINKNDPRIVEFNKELTQFKQFLNRANNELANLSYSVQTISWTTETYQQHTCNHKFTEQQDYDTINNDYYTYVVCSNCGLVDNI